MTGRNISADTIARTIVLVLALVNQIFAVCGRNQIDIASDNVYQLVSLCWTIGASIAAWWKNNSFTSAALAGDKKMKELKKQ